MADLFPWATTDTTATTTDLPLCQDGAWDFENDKPLMRNGKPIKVTGLDAVTVWAFHALKTARYCHPMFTTDYGQSLTRLIGQGFSPDTTAAEVVRYITDCLTVSPYITAVTVTNVALDGDSVTADVAIDTIYGRSELNV